MTGAALCHLSVWLAADEVGDTVKLYDPGFRAAGRVTVTAIGVPQPPGRYRPPANASHTMPHTALGPEPQAWYVLLSVAGAALPGVGFDWVAFNADKGSAGFELINNTIRNHRARGMLIKNKDPVSEDLMVLLQHSTALWVKSLFGSSGETKGALAPRKDTRRAACR